ncbi:hypothetical protein Y1Q_0014790 [Alligator mississippiensis]|uniref:Uncharacterized protein n=1 Tax=Alligator mississippiensis TaxID=8496 RepID=A0A151M1X6_ALLMI|nr:hypothetical protein Y1Q_0014790 [Alligator mississippiensis]
MRKTFRTYVFHRGRVTQLICRRKEKTNAYDIPKGYWKITLPAPGTWEDRRSLLCICKWRQRKSHKVQKHILFLEAVHSVFQRV